MEDVRKTGPVGLKGINTQQLQEVEEPKRYSALYRGRTPQSYGMGVDIPIMSSTENLGRKHDDNILTIEQIRDVEDMRARNQTALGRWANGITKGGILAGTTFLDGTLGLILGSIDALSNIDNKEETGWETFSRLWDNEFSNGMAKINEWSEQALPNYRTQEEREKAWYQNLGTANFWADTFLKNMGFTVGAYLSGSSFTKVLKSAGLIKTGLGAATAGSIYGAINEARVEANHNSTDFYKGEQKKLEDSYAKEYDAIVNSLSYGSEDKLAKVEELNNKYQTLQDNLNERKSKMGLGTFIGNTVFLSINDFFTMGRMYAKGFQNAKRAGKSIMSTADDLFASDQSISRYVTRQGNQWVADNISISSAVGRGLTKGLLEGNEEMAQRFMAGTSTEWFNTDSPDAYFNAQLDSDAIVETEQFLSAALKGFKDSYGNGDAYEEFAVGFLTGALGIPTFGRVQNSDASTVIGRGKPVGITGGIWGEISMAKAANKEMNEAVAFMNKYEQKLSTVKDHFVRSQAFTNAMSGWSQENDAFEYKNMEDNDDFVAISRYAAMGKLDYLKALVNQDFENISDETLQAIARETSTDTSGWYAVDGTYTPDGEEGAAEMRKELIKKRDKILEEIAKYETAVRETRSIANKGITEDQITELAWLHWKGSRFKERYKQMKEDFPTFYTALSENLKTWEEAVELLEEGLQEGDTEEAKSLSSLRKTIEVTKQFIDKISSSKNLMSISAFLDSNKDFLNLLNSKDFYDAFGEHSTLSEADYKKVITNLIDIGRVANAYKTFNQRYKEFIENPTKINRNRRKLFAKKEAEQQAVNKSRNVAELENLSVNEIVQKVKDGEVEIEELKNIVGLDDSEVEEVVSTEVAKKIQEVESILTSIEDGKAEAMRMYQNGELDDQEFQDVIALMEASGLAAESVDQVFDMDLEAALDTAVLDTTEVEDLLPDLEKAISKEGRLDEARGKVNFIRGKINSREQSITETPNPSEKGEETGHDSSPTAETVQENKARKEAEAKRGAVLKSMLEKVDALVSKEDKIPVKDAVSRMYDTAKTLFNNGLSAAEIFDILRKTPQYETAKKYPEVLKVVKDFVESLYNPVTSVPQTEVTFDDVAEQEVIVSDKEDVETQNSEIKKEVLRRQKSDTDASSYWQPSTTQFPIYRKDGSRIPFYEVAKTLKKEDGTPRYTQEQLKRMEVVYKYLESKGTFALRNSQALAEKSAVHFTIDPTLNQEAGDVVILLTDSSGHVIGDLVDTTHDSSAKHANLIETSNAIKQEYEEWVNAGNTGVFTSQKYKSQIVQLMVGHVEYSEERHSLNEIFTVTTSTGATKQLPFKIAVYVADKGSKHVLTTTSESGGKKGVDPIGDKAITPLKGKKGQPYLLIPTNNPKRAFMPVPFAMPYYDRGTAKSTLGGIIDGILEDIRTIASKEDSKNFSMRLAEHLGKAWREGKKTRTSFHVNRKSVLVTTSTDAELKSGIVNKEQRTLISISYVPEKGSKVLFSIDLDPNDPEAINKLKAEMFKHHIPFRINRKYLNKKIGELEYNHVIGELANTNVEPGFVTTTNNWFTIAPVSPEGVVQKPEKIASTRVNPTANTSAPTTPTKKAIEYNGKTFFVDEQWNVTDEDGKSYTKGENTLKFLGYAWGVIKGEDMTKPYNTEWGMYDPVKRQYIQKEQAEPVVKENTTIAVLESESTSETESQTPAGEEVLLKTKPELIADIKAMGLLNTPKRQKMAEFLSEEQLTNILGLNPAIMRQVIQKLEQAFDFKNGQFKKDPDSILKVDRNREAVGEYRTFDKEKELKWLEQVLPQFKERTHLIEGLIKIVNGVNSDRAFGKFVNGHIILSNVAAEGTVYHEAFHAVVNTLLSESELLDLLNEGKKQFGLTDDIAVEEKLAEGFRRYIQIEQGFGGKIIKAFRRLKHYIQYIKGKESVIHKLYYNISQGYYTDKRVYETEVSRNREVDLSTISLEELKELKDFLDSKSFQELHPNRVAVVDYVASTPLLKKAYELGLLKDVRHQKDNSTRRIVPKTTELNKMIRAKKKGEDAFIVNIIEEKESSVYKPTLTREQQISEAALAWQEREFDIYDEITEYHDYKSNYAYLSLEDKNYVDSTGISKEKWDKLPKKVKEAILHCK